MMKENKIITYISFAKKAGDVCIGFDAVKSSICQHKSKLVILLNDASDRTKNELEKFSNINNIQCICVPFNSDVLLSIFYKKVVAISILNLNLATAILKI